MCNRYVPPDERDMENFWHIGRLNPNQWVRDLAPRRHGPLLRPIAGEAGLELVVRQWALIPWFAKPAKEPTPMLTVFLTVCRRRLTARMP